MVKILLVEDRAPQREVIAALLSLEGYSVIQAHDGEEGLRLATEERPDLILTDLRMPKMDGEEMARLLRTDDRPLIPLIAITSMDLDPRRRSALAPLFRSFLRKPIDPTELLSEVSAVTGRAKVAGREG